MRVGRHADVVKSNQMAALADEDYITQCKAQGIYPLGYYPHNVHFVWMGATATGQSKLAIESAKKVASVIPKEALGQVPILQGFVVVPYWALVQFSKWDEILADKGPPHATPFTRGAWRYARAMALIGKRPAGRSGQGARAAQEDRGRPVAQVAGHVLEQHRVRDPADRAGSHRRRACGQTPAVGHGAAPPRARRPV